MKGTFQSVTLVARVEDVRNTTNQLEVVVLPGCESKQLVRCDFRDHRIFVFDEVVEGAFFDPFVVAMHRVKD